MNVANILRVVFFHRTPLVAASEGKPIGGTTF